LRKIQNPGGGETIESHLKLCRGEKGKSFRERKRPPIGRPPKWRGKKSPTKRSFIKRTKRRESKRQKRHLPRKKRPGTR